MVRLQTFIIVTGFGAKKKAGGDLKPEDLWRLNSDGPVNKSPVFDMTTDEYREWYKNIKEKYKLK